MATMTIRLPDAKHTRLKQLAARQGVSLNKLIEEWSSVALAQFDAETRFRVRAARGNPAAGLALLDKLDLALAPRSRASTGSASPARPFQARLTCWHHRSTLVAPSPSARAIEVGDCLRAQSPKPKSFVDDRRRTSSAKPQTRTASVVPQPLHGLGGTPRVHRVRTRRRVRPTAPRCRAVRARCIPLVAVAQPWRLRLAAKPFRSRRHGIGSMYWAAFRRTGCLSPDPLRAERRLPAFAVGRWSFELHRPTTSLRRVHPVASFVCASVPGTTRWHAPAAWTALPTAFRLRSRRRRWATGSPGPTGGTLIRVRRLKHRLTRSRHRIPLRPPHSLRG